MTLETRNLVNMYRKENFNKLKNNEIIVTNLFLDFLDDVVSQDMNLNQVFKIILETFDKKASSN